MSDYVLGFQTKFNNGPALSADTCILNAGETPYADNLVVQSITYCIWRRAIYGTSNNLKSCIWREDGSVVANSIKVCSVSAVNTWNSVSFTDPKPILNSRTIYYFGLINEGSVEASYNTGTGLGFRTGNCVGGYANPGKLTRNNYTDYRFSIYMSFTGTEHKLGEVYKLGNNTDTYVAGYGISANNMLCRKATATQSGRVLRSWFQTRRSSSNNGQVIRMGLFKQDGTFVGASDGWITVNPTDNSWNPWWEMRTWYPYPDIVAGENYYITAMTNCASCAAHSEYMINLCVINSAGSGGKVAMNYTTPTNFNPANLVSTQYGLICYLEYESSEIFVPSMKLEGIAPLRKLEGISWSNFRTVR